MTDLAGKVIVITGGASGIGAATVRVTAARGAHVVIGDVDDTGGTSLEHDLGGAGLSASFVHADVTQEADCRSLMQAAISHYGTLDVLIACAGILQGALVDAAEFDLEVFERVQDVNVRGTFLSTKHAVATMGERGGTVLLISSAAGVSSGSSSVAYGTSKAAIHGLGLVIERHLGDRPIRVNTVCPGAISTPLKRANVAHVGRAQGQSETEIEATQRALHDPDGVARVLAYLASDDAAYVRGTVFTL